MTEERGVLQMERMSQSPVAGLWSFRNSKDSVAGAQSKGLYERRQARGQVKQAVSQARLTALFFWPKRLAWGRKRRGLPSF